MEYRGARGANSFRSDWYVPNLNPYEYLVLAVGADVRGQVSQPPEYISKFTGSITVPITSDFAMAAVLEPRDLY